MNTTTLTSAKFSVLAIALTSFGCGDPGSGNGPATSGDTETDGGGTDDGDDDASDGGNGSTDGGNGSTDGDDGGGTPCPESRTCAGVVPIPWNGPVILKSAEDGETPTCDGEFDEFMGTFSEQFTAPPADCECQCGPAQNPRCDDSMVVSVRLSGPACGVLLPLPPPSSQVTIASGACQTVSIPSGSRLDAIAELSSDGCAPFLTETLPPVTASGSVALCQTNAFTGGCGDGEVCVQTPDPASTTGNVCMWSEGDVACPPGPYQERTVYYADATDTRACEACTCGDAVGSCDASVRGFNLACGGGLATLTGNVDLTSGAGCGMTTGSTNSVVYTNNGVISASCDPEPAVPSGEVTPAEPITVCCA